MVRTLFFHSSLGWILIGASSEGVCLLHFCGELKPSQDEISQIVGKEYPGAALELASDSGLLGEVRAAVAEYLDHGAPLPALLLDPGKGTSFEREVWKALSEIPFGAVRSYAEIARSIGRPKSARAVGQACGKNPIALLIPCHRVVASGGKLGGYSAGLEKKKFLLKLEQESGVGAP